MRYIFRKSFFAWASAFVLLSVIAGTRLAYRFDFALVRASQVRASGLLDTVGNVFSTTGGWELTSLSLAVLAGVMFWRGHQRRALLIVGVFLATAVIEYLLKSYLPVPSIQESLGRAKESVPILEIEYPYPYPSGHMLRSTILLGALYLWSGSRVLGIVSLLYLVGMGLTRIYLGVHWPSDVLGGFFLGAAAVSLAFVPPEKKKRKV